MDRLECTGMLVRSHVGILVLRGLLLRHRRRYVGLLLGQCIDSVLLLVRTVFRATAQRRQLLLFLLLLLLLL